jgi:hypothetical protein
MTAELFQSEDTNGGKCEGEIVCLECDVLKYHLANHASKHVNYGIS